MARSLAGKTMSIPHSARTQNAPGVREHTGGATLGTWRFVDERAGAARYQTFFCVVRSQPTFSGDPPTLASFAMNVHTTLEKLREKDSLGMSPPELTL